ncbi:uncharacterized protein LOC126375582 [Pectinophora gossypiella]|uniref:uncharacterized protein LOC126375582 n=1 Tax=Pectinophora gossypiella TaxID=13191 RepID=UPI00214DF6B5|nr:uncharacterized protein LOC126375582 [Pectinophora gossypiella]
MSQDSNLGHYGLIVVCFSVNYCALRDYTECHDDFNLDPPDGLLVEHNTFTWLGFLQYVHEVTGTPHFKMAPRVLLVHKQFVLGTATDMLKLPYNYKIGTVIFGQYERQESDCDLKMSQAKNGENCGPAYMEIPYVQIYAHPEYSRFGVINSLALMKLLNPLTSHYMMPICLPTLGERERQRRQKLVFMVDYVSAVPEDFDEEKMAKKTLHLLTHKDCDRHRRHLEVAPDGITHALCSSGCGIRPGAPIISHATTGAFELMGISLGGGVCVDHAMRDQFNPNPPMYIDVYPYVTWITNIITAHVIPLPYPKSMRRSGTSNENGRRVLQGPNLRARVSQKEGWSKRTYLVGNWCFESHQTQMKSHFFYSEKFQVHATILTRLKVMLKVSAGVECTISCARLVLPNRMTQPKIEGIGGYNITLTFNTEWFPRTFSFALGLTGIDTGYWDLREFLNERPKPILWD